MGINKVQYGNTTLIDLTSDTVTADKLMQGYTAHDRTGALITGTATGGGSGGNVWQDAQGYVHLDDEGTTPITVEALSVTQNGTYTAAAGHAYSPVTVNVSGGGGGLEYETGTWTPSEDVARPTINFTNTHSSMPVYVCLTDSGNYYDTQNSNMNFVYCDYSSIASSPIYVSSTTNLRYALVFYIYRGTSAMAVSNSYNHITLPIDDQSEGSTGFAKYWVKPDSFRPYTNSDSRYWRAGRTYKWIAVWAPTT